MKMHLYAFGSVCRGEIDHGSDVDLLACVDGPAPHIDLKKYSLYSYERLQALWKEGNPFAWHLHLESKLLYASDNVDYLASMGVPEPYNAGASDCAKFQQLFDRSYEQLIHSSNSATFHLSCIFLAIRNFATCRSLSLGHPIFSRKSPLLVEPCLNIDPFAFSVLTRARLLSTRGHGQKLTDDEINATISAIANVPTWMAALWEGNQYERV